MTPLAPDNSRLIFPLCGLSYNDVRRVCAEAPNKRKAAQKLGVSERQFSQRIKDLGLGHWFGPLRKPRPRCITPEDIRALAAEGLIMLDAAEAAGVDYSYFKRLVREYGLRELFPSIGKARWIGRRGYAG